MDIDVTVKELKIITKVFYGNSLSKILRVIADQLENKKIKYVRDIVVIDNSNIGWTVTVYEHNGEGGI